MTIYLSVYLAIYLSIYLFIKRKKLSLLFSMDALNGSKVRVKTSISSQCFSFEIDINQKIYNLFSTTKVSSTTYNLN